MKTERIACRKAAQRFREYLRNLARNEDGGTITTIAVSAVALVAFVGLAVDTTRGYMLKQRLAYAVDVAALAAAKTAANTDVNVIGQRYFNANFPAGYMGASNVNVSFALNAEKTQVTVTASADMPTALMTVVGVDQVDIGSETIAQRQANGLELALALDTTGSMNGYIDDLQDAANGLLDVLYGENEETENLYVSLVPFDTRVNLADYPGVVDFTPSSPNNVCANPRAGNETNDTPPSSSQFTNSSPTWWPSNNPPYGCVAQSALGLTATKSTLVDKINAMTHGGGTRADVAASWAFRMLSPDWRGLWGNPDLPLDYDEPLMEKAAIIMTDGQNSPLDGTSKATANARLTEACNNMTNAGITVYTVQFRTNNSTLKTLLTNCATSPSHYYHAANGQLSAVFNEIAAKLSNLRLIK